MAKPKVSRLDQAIAVRDAALTLLRADGHYDIHGDGVRCLYWKNDSLYLLHRTPFQRMPPMEGEFVRKAIMCGMALPKMLGYGLDVWETPGGKRFNFEWDDKGNYHLASFKPGAWRDEIYRLASSLESLRTGTAS